ncbi:GGDEF domain-containing protein [Colwellia asteriadis]|uniref:diguanylate cyclase n=1 Tax=Colwellia asteriadis TaxID=517723 RepID=A0ABP3WGQ9_9GAMM
MQTLNVLDNRFSSFSTLSTSPADELAAKQTYEALFSADRTLSLVELFNTTLDLASLLNNFSIEATRYLDFSGLFFKSYSVNIALDGSKKAKYEHRFDLKISDTYIGTLTYAINTPMSLINIQILDKLHQCLSYPLKNAISYYDAIQLAMQDALTGLGNRRYFDEQLKRAMHNANRHHSVVGLVLGDLNKFKAINDNYGHAVGDQVLIEFSNILRLCIRDSDSLFRFGGDEFAILIENANESAINLIEHRVSNALHENILLSKYNLGCSLGATLMNRADSEQSIFARADRALYRKKAYTAQHLSVI